MSLVCGPCRDTTPLDTGHVVLEAQVIAFIDAHSPQDGHVVKVSVETVRRKVS